MSWARKNEKPRTLKGLVRGRDEMPRLGEGTSAGLGIPTSLGNICHQRIREDRWPCGVPARNEMTQINPDTEPTGR